MTPVDLKKLRERLGLSLSEMAAWLGLAGDNRAHVVWEYETGRREMTGPVRMLYALYERNVDPERLGLIELTSREQTPSGS